MSIDATSSLLMNGASMPSAYPLTRTIGSPRSRRAAYRVVSAVVSACRPLTKTMPETPRSSSIVV